MLKVRQGITYMREFGINRFLRELCYRFINYYYERSLGVNTASYVKKSVLGVTKPDSLDYGAIGYHAFYSALKRIRIDISNSILLDYGAGKGRIMVAAAIFPFRKIIGVELSSQLVGIARRNIESMKHRRAKSIEIYQADATEFGIPNDVNLFCFFNPFTGNDLINVIERVYLSYKEYPRQIFIIYFNKGEFERIMKDKDWLVRVYETSFYPEISCGIYETRAVGVY
jgi:hypothetical protein